MTWTIDGPQGNEAAKVKYDIVPYTRGRGLDLGCGPFKTYPHFIGVDNGHHAAEFGWQMKPDVWVDDCADLSVFGTESMDFVFSSHLLEHIEDYKAALAEWWRVLKPGGHLVLYLPHKDFYPNCGEPGANPDHKHDYLPGDIIDAMEVGDRAWDLVCTENRNDGIEYSFLQVYKKRPAGEGWSYSCYDIPPEKTACVCRYGGFGDMIQTSAILPELKRQGYHVVVMTTPSGQDILKHDPHIDGWVIQDKDQVPNEELHAYWSVQAKKYDKFINLSESVEGTLLAIPGRSNHAWPDSMRRKYMNQNYLEFCADIAEIPHKPEPAFYPSQDETAFAVDLITEAWKGKGEPYVILWALAGSSVHKFYPWQDQVIARVLMSIPKAMVIFTGDYACKILEQGWENEPRVIRASGGLAIRESLALAQQVNCVVGPETGVLNAVGFDPAVHKVVMLSHSTANNLTRDWVNTDSLVPDVPCYPCHRLHYTRDFCPEHESGCSVCAASITPDAVFDAIWRDYESQRTKNRLSQRCG